MVILLAGCGPGLEFNPAEMTPEQMLQRATHIFIGTIESQTFERWPFFRVSGDETGYWRVLRRDVRVEALLRGSESHDRIGIYEIFWTGGTTGDWNSTQDNRRYLFLVRVENGRYHVVRDWWRSIYEVKSGVHDRLPLDDSRPFWERVALLMWWVKADRSHSFGDTMRTDPGQALSTWRTIKLLRGLLRHPERPVQHAACETLLHWGGAQDECWDSFSADEQVLLNRFHNVIPPRGFGAREN